MKPLKLEIEGLNSFHEKQIIDFSAVTRDGIFGIFGDTGSGKSTILDAVVIALYGRTQKGNTKKNFVNLACKKATVAFTFEILCDGRRRVFEFYREFFRADRNGKVLVYEWLGGDKILLADKEKNAGELVENIVGLGFEDFKKCIALPQGEFDKFVKARKGDRLDLMARLFSLEKYGERLFNAAAARCSDRERAVGEINAKLAVYDGVDENKLAEAEKTACDSAAALEKILPELAEAEKTAAKYGILDAAARELEEIETALAAADARKDEIDDLRDRLGKSLPAARAVELLDGIAADENRQKDNEARLEFCRRALAAEEASAAAFSAEKQAETDAKRALLLEKRNALIGLKETFEEEKALEKSVEDKRRDYLECESRMKKAKKDAEAFAVRLDENARLRARETAGADYDEIFKGVRAEAVRSEYLELDRLNKEQGEIPWLAGHIRKKLGEYGDFAPSASQLFNAIEEKKKRDERIKDLADAAALFSAQLAKSETEAQNAEKTLAALKADGAALAERMRALKAKIFAATGGEDYAAAVEKIDKDLLAHDRETRRREEARAATLRRIGEFTAEISAKTADLQTLKKKIGESREKCDEILKNCGIMNTDEARSFALDDKTRGKIEKEIADFDALRAGLAARRAEKKKALGEYDKAALKAAEENAAKLKAEADRLRAAGAVAESEVNSVKARLKEKSALSGALDEAVKKCEVARKLQQMFKGRAFLEYVAEEYLVAVTAAASVTLQKLTSGRYSLRYDQDFFVIDNINGGAARSTDTLSGGEIFLVSLALAFALSAEICAKSDRPIEFFFLDEGFGTLDEKLTDTVLDSLEKFRNSHFTIGLISHVRELKERINAKIIVGHATEEHGSTIDIAY